jgi:isoquinoline 1-oxidoreductase beta subunit
MILDQIASRAAGPDRAPAANLLSRRTFLQAGAAAGGGLMLSLHLPLANGDAKRPMASCPTPSCASNATGRSS